MRRGAPQPAAVIHSPSSSPPPWNTRKRCREGETSFIPGLLRQPMSLIHWHQETQITPLQYHLQREEHRLKGREVVMLTHTHTHLSTRASDVSCPASQQTLSQLFHLVGFFPTFQGTGFFLQGIKKVPPYLNNVIGKTVGWSKIEGELRHRQWAPCGWEYANRMVVAIWQGWCMGVWIPLKGFPTSRANDTGAEELLCHNSFKGPPFLKKFKSHCPVFVGWV